ncbi:MAG: hypothetical protein AMXMBFR64_52410 [Myxococcales bacterium]
MKVIVGLVALGLVALAQDARAQGVCDELAEEVYDVRSWAPDRGEVIVEREQEWCVIDDAIGEARDVYSWYEVLDRNGKALRWFVSGNEIQRSQFAVRMLKGDVPPEALFGEEDLEEYEKARKYVPASRGTASPTGACTVKVETTAKSVFPIKASVLSGGKPIWTDAPKSGDGKKYSVDSWWVPGADLLLVRYSMPSGDKKKSRTASDLTVISAYREAALAPCFKK